MKTMAPTDLQDNLELTAEETRELPRWSAHKKLAEPQIIYKMTPKFKETSIV